jgi:hypothetical protein
MTGLLSAAGGLASAGAGRRRFGWRCARRSGRFALIFGADRRAEHCARSDCDRQQQ